MGDDILDVGGKLSGTGAEAHLRVGADMPKLLAQLMPKRALKNATRMVIGEGVVRKIRAREPLDDAEVEWIEAVMDEPTARYARRMSITQRAAELVQGTPAPTLPSGEPEPAESNRETSEDWKATFWDDASLATSEVAQEVYAQILAGEARAPGSISKSTLGVLRYLDPEAAEAFQRILPGVLPPGWIPRIPGIEELLGITYGDLLVLEAAGLLNADAGTQQKFYVDVPYLIYGPKVLTLNGMKDFSLSSFTLTRAGRDLARVATYARSDAFFTALGQSLVARRKDSWVAWAEPRLEGTKLMIDPDTVWKPFPPKPES